MTKKMKTKIAYYTFLTIWLGSLIVGSGAYELKTILICLAIHFSMTAWAMN